MENKKYSLIKISNMPEFAYMDQDGCHWNSAKEWFYLEILGGCGCGSSEDIAELAFNLISLFATDFNDRKWSVYDDIEYEILANWMYSKELIEHGSSISGSWLTNKGKAIYSILEPKP